MIHQTKILRKLDSGYTLKQGEKVEPPFVYQVNGLTSTVQILRNDIGMKFGIKKFGIPVLKRGKESRRVPWEGVEMPDGERIKDVEEDEYKYLGTLEYNKIKESEIKENFQEEYLRRTNLIIKGRFSGKNKIMVINTCDVYLMRYGAGIVKWRKSELGEIDRKTRKVTTRNKELRPRSDFGSSYVSKMDEGRGLIGCKMCVKEEENNPKMLCQTSQ